MPDVVIGVEIEYSVVDGHRYANTEYVSEHEVYNAGDRASLGTRHNNHGKLVKAIESVTDEFVLVGYDGSASKTRRYNDGLELRGRPGSLDQNLESWGYLYDSWAMDLVEANEKCGMHVHMSGDDLTQDTVIRMAQFINAPENAPFIRYLAGRYNHHYCPIARNSPEDMAILWHGPECIRSPRKKIDRSEVPVGGEFCCEHLRHYRQGMYGAAYNLFIRGAINLTPQAGTGDIELRLFAAPDTKQRMAANVEFAHALVKYCKENASPLYPEFCRWLEATGRRRLQYRNLFRWLRERNYVRGLIPRT